MRLAPMARIGRAKCSASFFHGYHERLLRAAGYFSDRYLVSGRNPDSHNVTNPVVRSLSGGIVTVAGAVGPPTSRAALGERAGEHQSRASESRTD
jgi:hypothetical protein